MHERKFWLLSLLFLACQQDLASVPSADASIGDAASSAGSALIMRCQALANNFAAKCSFDIGRTCYWGAYAKLCATGETQLLIDSMNCLDSTTCRTFSDPNQGETCLNNLHTTSQSAAAKAYIQKTCTACGGTGCPAVNGTAEIFPYLTDADIGALAGCQGSACRLDTIAKACISIPDIQLFAACSL